MENKKKTIFNVVFLLVVFVGTIYGVFYGEDLGEIAQIIKTVNPLWLIPGVACGIYLGRIHYHLLYDAYTWDTSEKENLFFVFIGGIFL